MLIRILFILNLGLAMLPAWAGANTILVLGDSLSAAYGMQVQQGWVALLQKRLREENFPHTIVNSSISGDTTANALARLDKTLQRHQPNVVVLELGGNDGLRGLSLQVMQSNLASMIETVQAAGARVLLLGIDLPPNYGSAFTSKFRAVYEQLAQQYQVSLLPSLVGDIGTHPELMQSDGIHPNASAQPLMEKLVWQYLQPLLVSLPS